jgi:hypothetical protein
MGKHPVSLFPHSMGDLELTQIVSMHACMELLILLVGGLPLLCVVRAIQIGLLVINDDPWGSTAPRSIGLSRERN